MIVIVSGCMYTRNVNKALTLCLADTKLDPLPGASRVRVKHFRGIVGQLKGVAVLDGYIAGAPVDQNSCYRKGS